MRKKHFYSHIVETTELSLSLGEMHLSQEERVHLISLIESSLHHVVLDAILSELSEKDKRIFLSHLNSNNHDKIWEHLNKTVTGIEDKIRNAADKLKKDMKKDIENAPDDDQTAKTPKSK